MGRLLDKLEAIFNPKMRMVLADHCYIALIDNPSKRLQLAAVRQSPSAITLIENPCEKAKAVAVIKNPLYMRIIQRPSEKLKRLIVSMNPDNITYINNPSKELQVKAVQSKPSSILGIASPCEEAQKAVVNKEPGNIRLISNPCHSAQLSAVEKDPSVIKYIKNPCMDAVRTVAQNAPKYLEGMVLDDYTMKIIGENIPFALKYTTSAPISELYDTLATSPDKFSKVSLSDTELHSLYDSYLKIDNIEYYSTSTVQQQKTDRLISDLCSNREIPEYLQSKMVNDRLSNIVELSKPEPSVLSYALARLTGNEISDTVTLNRISEPIKELVKSIDAAFREQQRPLPDSERAFYENSLKDYDEQKTLQERFEKSLEKAYNRFQKATGLELKQERHESINRNFIAKKYGNSSESPAGRKNEMLYKQCNKTMSDINMNNEKEINKALEKSGLKDIKLSPEQRTELIKKGNITIPGGKAIQKIKTPVGYTFKVYNIVSNLTRQGQAEM